MPSPPFACIAPAILIQEHELESDRVLAPEQGAFVFAPKPESEEREVERIGPRS
jgi:hypothetical protein